MAGVNKVILLGNLGADPEVKTLENGAKVARLRIATTERYKDRDGNIKEQTEWHSVDVWRGLADIAEKYLQKGRQVYIEGKLRTRKWTDKDNQERYTTDILGLEMTLVGGKPGEGSGSPAPRGNQVAEPGPEHLPAGDDDLPF